MFSSSKSTFDKLLEAATSPMLMDPSWATNLELCDSIRQGDVNAKYAVAGIRKKMKDQRPLVAKYALIVLETCVKNCGQPFHEEIATQDFMEEMRLLASTGSQPVKDKILSMMQAWNHVFRNKSQYQPILATYNLMKMEGHKFPPLNESDAMFSADAAPAWKEGDVCHMCRVKFTTFTRQHHCRACGEVFCAKCSSKSSIIPKIGMEREVRVCDHCYDEINPNDGKTESESSKTEDNEDGLPAEYLASPLAKEPQTKPPISDRDREAQEEEEMQLALALSLSENETKQSSSGRNWSAPVQNNKPAQPMYQEIPKSSLKTSNEPKSNLYAAASAKANQLDSASSELSKYLDRSYWERKNAGVVISEPSAPHGEVADQIYATAATTYQDNKVEEEVSDGSEAFVQTMDKSIEMFIDRMNNVRYKGKHISMDTTVQSLFQSLSAMHPQLMKLMEEEEESKANYEAMLQKLSVIREARESLNDMRAQHREKVQQQELEQEMLRRMQMEQKLELMRQQKQEYLEYQRQLQLQRQRELEEYQQEKLRQQALDKIPGYMGEIPVDPYNAMQQPNAAFAHQYHEAPTAQQYNRPPKYPGHHPNENPADISLDGNFNAPPSYDLAVKPGGYQPTPIASDANRPGIRQREDDPRLHVHHHQNKVMRDPSDPRLMVQSYSPQHNSHRLPEQALSAPPQQQYVSPAIVTSVSNEELRRYQPHPQAIPQTLPNQVPATVTRQSVQQILPNSQPPSNQHNQFNAPHYQNVSTNNVQMEKTPQRLPSHPLPTSQPQNEYGQPSNQPQIPNTQYLPQNNVMTSQTQQPLNNPAIGHHQQQLPINHQISVQNQPGVKNQPIPNQQMVPSSSNIPTQNQTVGPPIQNQAMQFSNQQIAHQNQPIPSQNQQMVPQNQPMPPLNQQAPPQNQQFPLQNQQIPQQQPNLNQQKLPEQMMPPANNMQYASQPNQPPIQQINQPQFYVDQQQQPFSNPQQQVQQNYNNQQPQYSNQQFTSQQQPPISNQQQPPIGNQQQPPIGNQQQPPIINQQQPPIGNQQQPPIGNQQQPPIINQQQPPIGNQPQLQYTNQPQYNNQQPQYNQQLPQQYQQQPVNNLTENMKDLQLISFE